MHYRESQLWREIAAGLAIWTLGALGLTGVALHAVLWMGATEVPDAGLLRLTPDDWADLHDVFGLAFLASAATMLALGRPAWPARLPAHGVAALAIAALVALTLLHLPPASWLLPQTGAGEVMEPGEDEAGALPYPGAEQDPVSVVARQMEMDEVRVAIALQEAGLLYRSLDETLEAIATRNGTTADSVYEAIRHLEAPTLAPGEETAIDVVESRFMGRDVRGKTVEQLAEAASVPLDTALRRLRAAGIEAKPQDTGDAVAARSNVTPMDVLAVLVIEGYRPRR